MASVKGQLLSQMKQDTDRILSASASLSAATEGYVNSKIGKIQQKADEIYQRYTDEASRVSNIDDLDRLATDAQGELQTWIDSQGFSKLVTGRWNETYKQNTDYQFKRHAEDIKVTAIWNNNISDWKAFYEQLGANENKTYADCEAALKSEWSGLNLDNAPLAFQGQFSTVEQVLGSMRASKAQQHAAKLYSETKDSLDYSESDIIDKALEGIPLTEEEKGDISVSIASYIRQQESLAQNEVNGKYSSINSKFVLDYLENGKDYTAQNLFDAYIAEGAINPDGTLNRYWEPYVLSLESQMRSERESQMEIDAATAELNRINGELGKLGEISSEDFSAYSDACLQSLQTGNEVAVQKKATFRRLIPENIETTDTGKAQDKIEEKFFARGEALKGLYANVVNEDGSLKYDAAYGSGSYTDADGVKISTDYAPWVELMAQTLGVESEEAKAQLAKAANTFGVQGYFADKNKEALYTQIEAYQWNPDVSDEEYENFINGLLVSKKITAEEISKKGYASSGYHGFRTSATCTEALSTVTDKLYETLNISEDGVTAQETTMMTNIKNSVLSDLSALYKDALEKGDNPKIVIGKNVDALIEKYTESEIDVQLDKIFSKSKGLDMHNVKGASEVLDNIANGKLSAYVNPDAVKAAADSILENSALSKELQEQIVDKMAKFAYGYAYEELTQPQKDSILVSYVYARDRYDGLKAANKSFSYADGELTVVQIGGVGFGYVDSDGVCYFDKQGELWQVAKIKNPEILNYILTAPEAQVPDISPALITVPKSFSTAGYTYSRSDSKDSPNIGAETYNGDIDYKQRSDIYKTLIASL